MVVLTTFPPPTDGIHFTDVSTQAHISSTKNPGNTLGKGTLYIAESRVSWMSSEGRGFSLEYPAIGLHAVSRDTNAFPQECLYLMLEGDLGSATDAMEVGRSSETSSSESEDDLDDSEKITEVRFIPDDKGQLEAMYTAMADCQQLHPDPEDEGDSDDEYYGEEEGAGDALTPEGQATLVHLENIIVTGQQVTEGQGQVTTNGDAGDSEETMETESGQFDDA